MSSGTHPDGSESMRWTNPTLKASASPWMLREPQRPLRRLRVRRKLGGVSPALGAGTAYPPGRDRRLIFLTKDSRCDTKDEI